MDTFSFLISFNFLDWNWLYKWCGKHKENSILFYSYLILDLIMILLANRLFILGSSIYLGCLYFIL